MHLLEMVLLPMNGQSCLTNHDEDDYDLDGHTFITPGESDGKWAYQFNNVTADPSGQQNHKFVSY